jgi:hypothetical protein
MRRLHPFLRWASTLAVHSVVAVAAARRCLRTLNS